MEEIEVKFLDVDIEEFERKIVESGAIFVGEYFYKRKVYDYLDGRLDKETAWVRLRDEGEKITLTYKKRFGIENDKLREGGTNEIEIIVSDFEQTDSFLKSIGLVEKVYKENKRRRFVLDSVEIDIDTWPLIPPYIEIEGKTWESVEKLCKKIDLDWDKQVRGTNSEIYKNYGIIGDDYSVLTFEKQIKK